MAKIKNTMTVSLEEFGKKAGEYALDEFEYKGLTIRQWADKITSGEYQPVKPAHWYINPDGYYPQCSNCGYEPPRELIRRNGDALIFPRYCPEYGADTNREVR